MLKEDTLLFLEALEENNTREWFSENKSWYERAKSDFEQLVAQIIQGISSFDPQIGYLEPKKCIFRIYRDTRFSTDKTPYKNNFGAIFRGSQAAKFSGYYFHISPKESFISCGYYMPPSDQLKKIRKGIYDDYAALRKILDEKNFKKEIGDLYRDDTLQRVPTGFDKNHPAAEYMKLKSFYVFKEITKEQLLSNDLVPHIVSVYKRMQPLNDFLNDLLLD